MVREGVSMITRMLGHLSIVYSISKFFLWSTLSTAEPGVILRIEKNLAKTSFFRSTLYFPRMLVSSA